MLSQLTRQNQTNGSLDFARGDGRLLVVSSQLGSLSGNALENVCLVSVHIQFDGVAITYH